MSKLLLSISLALLVLSGTGCVWIEEKDDLVRYVNQVQQRPSRPIPALPSFEPYESFYYQGASQRNPFIPLVLFESEDDDNGDKTVDPGNTPAPNLQRSKDYLESFKLTDLTMVGSIAKGAGQVWALIVDGNGEIHRVAKGDYLGLDHGVVTDASEQKLKIQETISNGRGGWIKRPRSIELTEQDDS
ncbi:MAG: pilus assembly protein PilP [Pseudomonadales bacterium]